VLGGDFVRLEVAEDIYWPSCRRRGELRNSHEIVGSGDHRVYPTTKAGNNVTSAVGLVDRARLQTSYRKTAFLEVFSTVNCKRKLQSEHRSLSL
jgi:hypothetical protein